MSRCGKFPLALQWRAKLTVVAATILAIESLVFIAVHVKYAKSRPLS